MTTSTSSSTWVVDTGATAHICNDQHLFQSLSYQDGTSTRIAGFDNSGTTASGRGTVVISVMDANASPPVSRTLSLSGVYYVPTAGSNLLSVKACLKQHKMMCTFADSHVTFLKPSGSSFMTASASSDGLYIVALAPPPGGASGSAE